MCGSVQALEQIGFAIITGHGIPGLLLDEAHARIAPLFNNTSPAEKRRFAARRHGSVNQGLVYCIGL